METEILKGQRGIPAKLFMDVSVSGRLCVDKLLASPQHSDSLPTRSLGSRSSGPYIRCDLHEQACRSGLMHHVELRIELAKSTAPATLAKAALPNASRRGLFKTVTALGLSMASLRPQSSPPKLEDRRAPFPNATVRFSRRRLSLPPSPNPPPPPLSRRNPSKSSATPLAPAAAATNINKYKRCCGINAPPILYNAAA
jgi:hypothetical protein